MRRQSEKGYVLIALIAAASLVLLTLLVAITFTDLGSQLMTLQLNYQGRALGTANAGIVEGLDWFRRQASQPVNTFSPQRNTSATPPVDDTDTQTNPPSIVRDFQISAPGRIWGHYELKSGTAATGAGVLDLTQNRRGSAAGAGVVWQLQSDGYVYVRNTTDMTVAYNQRPNKVLAQRTLRSEISRLQINAPNAAIAIPACSKATLGVNGQTNVRVVGGPSGAGVACTSGAPSVANGATLSGTPQSSTGLVAANFTLMNVFGVATISDLASIADVNVTSAAAVPATLPAMQLVVINAGTGNTVTFDDLTHPLQGSGILVVVGNLQFRGHSNWNGIIYVTGNYSQNDPASVSGTVVAAGSGSTVQVTGSGDFAEIYYDPFIFSQIASQIGQYRFSRNAYVPCPPTDPLCTKRLSGNRESGL